MSQDKWQIKIPTRIKVFLWYLKRGVILTKDNLTMPQSNISNASKLSLVTLKTRVAFIASRM